MIAFPEFLKPNNGVKIIFFCETIVIKIRMWMKKKRSFVESNLTG